VRARTGVPAHRRTAFALRALAVAVPLCACAPVPLSAQQCPDGTPPPCGPRAAARAAVPVRNSVAVLYFDNLSRDTSDAYLADGLTEELTARLGQVGRLVVTSRAAVRYARQAAASLSIAQLGRTLNAAYLLSGSARRAGLHVRVTVELVRAATGERVWGEQYDRENADLLVLQEEIARAVATGIAGRLLPQERAALAVHATRNPAAYDHYLRGNFLLARRTREDIGRAIEEYDLAARLDPALAQAHARIALGYALLLERDWVQPLSPDSALALGFRSVDRALASDSASADGWMARGYLLAIRDPLQYTGALLAFERAVTLDARNPEVLHQYASKLYELGQFERAVVMERRALDADPARPVSQLQLAEAFAGQGRLDEAKRAADSAIAIDPSYLDGYLIRSFLNLVRGENAAARADADEALRLSTGARRSAWALEAAALSVAGDSGAASVALAHALAPEEQDRASWQDIIWSAVALEKAGRTEEAMRLLERLPRRALTWAAIRLSFPDLRTNPRFRQLLEANRPSGAPR